VEPKKEVIEELKPNPKEASPRSKDLSPLPKAQAHHHQHT
jgi:hypothetical protein